MKLRSPATRLFLILSVLVAFAYSGDDDNFSFQLSSDRIFSPGDPEAAVEVSGNAIGTTALQLRAYRIDDPVEFMLAQKDPHSPTLEIKKEANTFDMLRLGYHKVTRDARYAARDVMPQEAREVVRDVVDLNGVRAEEREEQALADSTKKRRSEDNDNIPPGAERYKIVANWTHQLKPNDDYWNYESVPVPMRDKGVYLVEARARGKRALTVVIISELGMVFKQARQEALAFIVDRKSGEKVDDFPLAFARGGKLLAEKETGGDGVVQVTLPPAPELKTNDEEDEDEWRWDYRARQVLVVGEKDGNFVISDPYYYGYGGDSEYKLYLHTDRPVYRPAQTVYFRGIARKVRTDGTYETVSNQSVAIDIMDARGGSIRKDSLKLNDMGSFSSEIVLGDEPPLGTYTIRVDVGQSSEWFNFDVEEYKKPEYKVVVTADKPEYTKGEMINATVKADYFFGSPVANAEVEFFVFRSEYWRPWWRNSEWAYLYEGSGDDFYTYRQEMVHSGTGKLNPDGTFQISYQTEDSASDDYVYRIQANVVDNSRRAISGSKSVEVTRGSFYISANTDKYVYKPGEDAKIIAEIATFAGDKPVATDFQVQVTRVTWDRVGDSVNYTYQKRTDSLWTGGGKTDAAGHGSVTYKPTQGGYYDVTIAAVDQKGTKVTESTHLWVAEESYTHWYREGSSDVQIIPDKPAYKAGETMTALVVMPAPGIDALISVEGTTIYSHQIERMDATSMVVHVPVKEEYAPMVFLSASAIVNDQMYTESQRITVVPEGKLIKLEVTGNKEIYKPGEKGTVTIRATDESGKPVSGAEVGVGIVDEAIYSIQPDATPDIQRYFYGNRWNEVYTSSSLSFSFYNSARSIDAEGLFSDSYTPAPKEKLVTSADRGRQNLAFGDIKGQMFVQPTMRKNFKDMMYWSPSARTGADGTAKLDVEFPDNLTTWRITVRAVTGNTAVGQAVGRVLARKDLLVRMEVPRFITQGDELLIATTVHNYLTSEKVTKVQFSGENIALSDRERVITIPANGEQRIDWRVKTQQTGAATLSVSALTNEESDAMQLAIPVLPRGMKIATGSVADIDAQRGSQAMQLNLPEGADPATGALSVTLSPSLASSILGSLDDLIGYPYGCVEQTMSRFLPTVVVAQTLQQLNLPFPEQKRQALPKMVNKGLTKLYGMQHEDGGWGWWVNDQSNPFMTAYVMYGLTVAKSAGYEVIEDRYQNGLNSLRAQLEARKAGGGLGGRDEVLNPTTEAYMLYVLAFIDKGSPEQLLNDRLPVMARIDSLNNYAKSLLALAANYQGYKQIATALATKLQSNATVTPVSAFWKGKSWHYEWEDDPVETSAYAVNALLTVKGESDLVRKGIRWLLSQKDGDSWHNTRQTAMVIYSLVDYLKNSKELAPDYTVVVRVNGQQAFTRKFTKDDVFAPELKVPLDKVALHSGVNTVTVEKSGDGRLYSSARLVYYASGPALQPASAGFRVSREYYLLRKKKQGETYVYTKSPYTGTVKTGEEIFVKVKLVPDASYDYFMLEDPLPAGCEVVKNTDGYTIPGERDYNGDSRADEGYYGWYWWYADREVRDEKVAFFARKIYQEPYEFSYIMRAQIPGSYSVMPSVGSLMYYPEVRGNGAALAMTITE
jgi:uncharacterized protein YfaS (alpha-2-macroglobulin family)